MSRRAFTLVEMLTVVVIIGILVTLVTLAVAGAQRSAKRARIAVELYQIAMAIEHYKTEIGEYPPDMFDDAALVRHVRKRFPRYTLTGSTVANQADNIRRDIAAAYNKCSGVTGVVLTASANNTLPNLAALTIWLGGFPDKDGKFSGFGADSSDPFDVGSGDQFDKTTFIDLKLGGNVQMYPHAAGKVPVIVNQVRANADEYLPFVYFRGTSSGGPNAYSNQKIAFDGDIGTAVPYMKTSTVWECPTGYQLIHPGLDGKFGTGPNGISQILAEAVQVDAENRDNITNFSDYKEIQTILP